MSVWTRRIAAGGVGALLVALLLGLGALAWLATSFDANRYKSTAVDWMRAHHQRTLTIDGPIELSLFPRLGVEVSKLSLSEAGRPQEFAALDEASLAIDVLPLLRGQLVIGGVKARGLRVAYLRDAKGRSNIADFLAGDKPSAGSGETRTDATARPLRFDVRRIDLADVRARVQDELTGIVGDVVLGQLSTGRLAERTDAPLSLAARFALTAPAVKGELNGDATLQMDLPARSFALKYLRLALKADTGAVSAIDAKLKGTLGWSGTQRALDASGIELLLSANTNSVKLVDSSVAIERVAFDPTAKSLNVHQLRARLRGTQGGQPMSLDLDWPALAMAGQKLSGSALAGTLKLGGTTALDASFQSAAPEGSIDALRLPGFEAKILSGGNTAGARKLAGNLRGDLLLRPAQPSLAIERLQLMATLTEEKLSPIEIGLRGQALASTQQSTWAVNGELNADPFDSQGQLTLTGPTPLLKATARFEAIDLNRFWPRTPDAVAAKAPSDAGTDAPVDLSPLRAVDGEFTLRAGKLAWQHYRATDLRLTAHLQGGMLRLTEFKGRAWNGDFDATAFADARASRVALKGTASSVDVQALLKDVAAKELIEGSGRVVLDLDTAGRSTAELKSRLAGTASLQLRDGALKGVDLAKLLRQTRAVLPAKTATTDTAHKASQTEKTDFSELSASFRIADGVASSQDLDLRSPFLRLGGEGKLVIPSGRIDYTARATLAATAQGQGGPAQAAVKGLTVPVRLTGPVEAPVWTILWTQMAGELLTPELKERQKDKVKERLKGLLK